MEQFSIFPAEECRQIRETCKADVLPDHVFGIAGSDKDPEALELARRHVRQAGLEGKIELTCQPLEKLKLEGRTGRIPVQSALRGAPLKTAGRARASTANWGG